MKQLFTIRVGSLQPPREGCNTSGNTIMILTNYEAEGKGNFVSYENMTSSDESFAVKSKIDTQSALHMHPHS